MSPLAIGAYFFLRGLLLVVVTRMLLNAPNGATALLFAGLLAWGVLDTWGELDALRGTSSRARRPSIPKGPKKP